MVNCKIKYPAADVFGQMLDLAAALVYLVNCIWPLVHLVKCIQPLADLVKCIQLLLYLVKCIWPLVYLVKCYIRLMPYLVKCNQPLLANLVKCCIQLLAFLVKCIRPLVYLVKYIQCIWSNISSVFGQMMYPAAGVFGQMLYPAAGVFGQMSVALYKLESGEVMLLTGGGWGSIEDGDGGGLRDTMQVIGTNLRIEKIPTYIDILHMHSRLSIGQITWLRKLIFTNKKRVLW